jgi:leucyl aminopeptidase
VVKVSIARKVPAKAGVVATLVAQDGLRAVGDRRQLERLGFTGELGTTLLRPRDGNGVEMLVGLGPSDGVGYNQLRTAAAAAAKAAGANSALVLDPGSSIAELDAAAAMQALTEGLILGGYQYDAYRTPSGPRLSRATIVGTGARGERDGLARGQAIAEAVCFARDLVNEPGGSLVPEVFCDRVVARAAEVGLSTTVWDRKTIEAERLGGLLAVNQGSVREPRFLILEHSPEGASGHIALVGKGITFDSGGLSIKPAEAMMTMKNDMGGGAAVVGAMLALAAIGTPVRVTGYVPLTDNMIGGDAIRPGDVFTSRNGHTVEVLNTDAEGRLILADALAVAAEAEPDVIVDLATLTGACIIALGDRIAGLMSNDETLVEEVRGAAALAGELVWPLPLHADYRKMLDSTVADIKNIGGRSAGTITAGLFLQEFVPEGTPWAHLDIAGPAFAEEAPSEGPKGATGFGVRTLVAFVEGRVSAGNQVD